MKKQLEEFSTEKEKKEFLLHLLSNDYLDPFVAHNTSDINGFYENERNKPTTERVGYNLMLTVTEISEATDALRKIVIEENQSSDEAILNHIQKEFDVIAEILELYDKLLFIDSLDILKRYFENPFIKEKIEFLKDGFLWELCDVIIRVFDTIGWFEKLTNQENSMKSMALLKIILSRNLMRDYRHGKNS